MRAAAVLAPAKRYTTSEAASVCTHNCAMRETEPGT